MTAQTKAHEALHFAIRAAEDRGDMIPCREGDGHEWISDKKAPQEAAATFCGLCPVRDLCFAAGSFESAGVWGGDRRVQWKLHRDNRERRNATPTLLDEL